MVLIAALTYTSRNLGDDIQTLAAMQYLPPVDKFLDRDRIAEDPGGEYALIGNGWWGEWTPTSWPPHPNLTILPISVSLNADYAKYDLSWYEENQPVGCRDTRTAEYLEGHGIQAWFSGCLTLTLPARDVPKHGVLTASVPRDLRPPGARELSNLFKDNRRTDVKWRLAEASRRLEAYRHAELVVTARIHTAFPCIAMGTPVVVVRTEKNRGRLTGYEWIPDHKTVDTTSPEQYRVDPPPRLLDRLREATAQWMLSTGSAPTNPNSAIRSAASST